MSAWRLLSATALDATAPLWMSTMIAIIQSQRTKSTAASSAYLQTFREVEIGESFPAVLAGPADLAQLVTSLNVTGPVSIKSAMTKGVPLAEATSNAVANVSGAAMRHSLDGGRETITATVAADPKAYGWARATSGKTCSFCAMLASRGPVYGERSVQFRSHDHCACSGEPVYSRNAPWPAGSERFREIWDESTAGLSGAEARSAFDAALKNQPATKLKAAKVETTIAQRTAADRARAREILDGDKGGRPPHPGKEPKWDDYKPGSHDIAEYDAAFDRWKADYDAWDVQYKAHNNYKSSLVDASNAPTDLGRELLRTTQSAGADVLAEARRRVPDIGRLREADLWARAGEGEASNALRRARDEFRSTTEVVRLRIAREKHGNIEYLSDLSLNKQYDLRQFVDADPEIRNLRAAVDTAKDNVAAAKQTLAAVQRELLVTERDAIMETLREIRPTGTGANLKFKTNSRSGEALAVQTAIKDAAAWYPDEWTATLGRERTIIHKKVQRGFQRDNRNGTIDIALSDDASGVIDTTLGKYDRVATHELAHGVESTNADVTVLEHIFYRERTAGRASEPCWPGASAKDRGIPDEFPSTYFGKSYGSTVDSHKELLSMSMDTMVAGRSGTPPMDDEHLSWLLGTWLIA